MFRVSRYLGIALIFSLPALSARAWDPGPVQGQCVETCDANGNCTPGCNVPAAPPPQMPSSSAPQYQAPQAPPVPTMQQSIQMGIMNGLQQGLQQGMNQFFQDLFKPEDPAVTAARKAKEEEEERRKRAQEAAYLEYLRQQEIARQKRIKEKNDRMDKTAADTLAVAGELGKNASDHDLLSDVGAPPKPVEVPERVVEKDVKAIGCMVASVLDQAKTMSKDGEIDAVGFMDDLTKMKKSLSEPLSGRDDSKTIQELSLSMLKQKGSSERQLIGRLLVVRDEKTGEVHLDESHSSTETAGAISRFFGRKLATKESQNLLHIDAQGNITAKDISGPVQKCLDQNKTPQ